MKEAIYRPGRNLRAGDGRDWVPFRARQGASSKVSMSIHCPDVRREPAARRPGVLAAGAAFVVVGASAVVHAAPVAVPGNT